MKHEKNFHRKLYGSEFKQGCESREESVTRGQKGSFSLTPAL